MPDATIRIENYSDCTIQYTVDGPVYRSVIVAPGTIQEIHVPPGEYDWEWIALPPCVGDSSGHRTFESGKTYRIIFS
jgi:hypothetical protein